MASSRCSFSSGRFICGCIALHGGSSSSSSQVGIRHQGYWIERKRKRKRSKRRKEKEKEEDARRYVEEKSKIV